MHPVLDPADVGLVPHARTARRLHWEHLPPSVRREVERRLGSPVERAESQVSGFTPGLYLYYDFDLEWFTAQANLGFSVPMDNLGTTLDLAAEVQQRPGQVVLPGEVDADHVRGVSREVDQRGRLPHPGVGRRAELLDQAVDDEGSDQVGDRDPGQAGRAREVGAACGPTVEQLLEQQRAVVATRVLLAELAARAESAADR